MAVFSLTCSVGCLALCAVPVAADQECLHSDAQAAEVCNDALHLSHGDSSYLIQSGSIKIEQVIDSGESISTSSGGSEVDSRESLLMLAGRVTTLSDAHQPSEFPNLAQTNLVVRKIHSAGERAFELIGIAADSLQKHGAGERATEFIGIVVLVVVLFMTVCVFFAISLLKDGKGRVDGSSEASRRERDRQNLGRRFSPSIRWPVQSESSRQNLRPQVIHMPTPSALSPQDIHLGPQMWAKANAPLSSAGAPPSPKETPPRYSSKNGHRLQWTSSEDAEQEPSGVGGPQALAAAPVAPTSQSMLTGHRSSQQFKSSQSLSQEYKSAQQLRSAQQLKPLPEIHPVSRLESLEWTPGDVRGGSMTRTKRVPSPLCRSLVVPSQAARFAIPTSEIIDAGIANEGSGQYHGALLNISSPVSQIAVFQAFISGTGADRRVEIKTPGDGTVRASIGTSRTQRPAPGSINVFDILGQQGVFYGLLDIRTDGSCIVTRNGKQVMTIDGDAEELSLCITTAFGEDVATAKCVKERSGVGVFRDVEHVDIQVQAGMDSVLALACILQVLLQGC